MKPPQSILVPTDFSPCSQVALAHATDLAKRTQAQLHLLHVLTDKPFPLPSSRWPDDRFRQAHERLHQSLQPDTEIETQIHRDVRQGVPFEQIVDYARQHENDLIVMGTRGRTGLSHLALGSVAERVLRHAPCPVLVARPPADECPTEPLDETADAESVQLDHETAPAIDLIRRAMTLRATDIHIDPIAGSQYSVRLRIDGRLEKYCEMDSDVASHLIHQLQNLANLDLADPYSTHEGRLRLPPEVSQLEARLTTAPVASGHAVAVRLFARDQLFRGFDDLGLSAAAKTTVDEMLKRGEGLVLATGPSGAGKTTTVYSMLEVVGANHRNVVSVEDPVEFPVPFIRQIDVNARHGITLISGLRTLLRMDPDVLFLGEIRDDETAEIAMRATSSGKSVFSTLHTRDVASTVTSLRDLHVDNRSLAGNLAGIVNQRLVRRLCEDCRVWSDTTDAEREEFARLQVEPPRQVASPGGCDTCRGTGYFGRIGVFEAAIVDEELTRAVERGAAEDEVRGIIAQQGGQNLATAVLHKVCTGITSLQEAREMRWL